jgi:ubiquinone/menaquinone biosynthesis C-methylase UbiE
MTPGLPWKTAADEARARARYLIDRPTRRRNDAFRKTGAPDGLPLPSPSMVYLVARHFDLREYYESGEFHAELLQNTLAKNGLCIDRFRSLLDFGCGCGRVVRHWNVFPSLRVHGSDYNAQLVAWCRAALPFASFATNGLAPPLPYSDESFDLVYSISVFTHLPEALQRPWIDELRRVLRPGGVAMITTKGRSRLDALSVAERRRFEGGDLVVQEAHRAGGNLCAAFHPESYVRNVLGERFQVVDFVPAAPREEQSQDLTLYGKPKE